MRKLRADSTGPVVVAVDYTASGRTIGTFADLSRLLTVPLGAFFVTDAFPGHTGVDTVTHWVDRISDGIGRVDAVLGFCTGAVYAGELVGRLAGTQQAPRLLLIDPEDASDRQLRQQCAHVVTGKLGSALDETRRSGLLAQIDELPGTGSSLAHGLAGALTQTTASRLVDMGLDERAAADLLDAIAGYLRYLGGAVDLPPRQCWSTAVALNSTTEGSGLDTLPPTQRASATAAVHNLPVPYADILRSPETAQFIDQWLTFPGPGNDT